MPDSELPKFVRIANRIRDDILSGDLGPGAEVPSERGIAVEWGVARPTAARALQELRRLGLVESRQGSGTFVRSDLTLHRRASDRIARSRTAGRVYTEGEWSQIVSARLAPAPRHIATALQLPAGTTVGRRHRLTGDTQGVKEMSTSWFPPDVVERAPKVLSRTRIREGSTSYVEAATGRRAVVGRDQLSARLAEARERRELGLEPPAAVLVVLHSVLDRKGQTLEVSEAVYPPGKWYLEHEYPVNQ